MDQGLARSEMTVDYAGLTRDCKTENQFNRVHIDLERDMTPDEFSGLMTDFDRGLLPDSSANWIGKWRELVPEIHSNPKRYVTETIDKRFTWYRQPQRNWSSRKVLVVFCGNADKPMLPLPVFLQALPEAEWDVLRVFRSNAIIAGPQSFGRPPVRRYLRSGREVADLDELVTSLTKLVESIPGNNLTVMGTSSGAFVAVVVSLYIGAQSCLAFGGGVPDSVKGFVAKLVPSVRPIVPTQVFLGFSGNNATDRIGSKQIQAAFGGRVLEFHGIERHDVLYPLVVNRTFSSVLQGLLRGQIPPAEIASYV